VTIISHLLQGKGDLDIISNVSGPGYFEMFKQTTLKINMIRDEGILI
jgi:hypothetical protein